VSKIITLGNSYYLLFVEARKNSETKPLAAVRGEAETKVIQEERQAAQEKWIKGLRDKAYIKIF